MIMCKAAHLKFNHNQQNSLLEAWKHSMLLVSSILLIVNPQGCTKLWQVTVLLFFFFFVNSYCFRHAWSWERNQQSESIWKTKKTWPYSHHRLWRLNKRMYSTVTLGLNVNTDWFSISCFPWDFTAPAITTHHKKNLFCTYTFCIMATLKFTFKKVTVDF